MENFTHPIYLGGKRFSVVDLTEPLREDIEVYPGEPRPRKEIAADIKKAGFQYNIYHLGEHNCHPHADAPSHQNPELQHRGMEIFGLDYAFNKAVMTDLSRREEVKQVDGINYLLTVEREHLTPYENQISDMGALVIRTGYDKWIEANRPHRPEGLPHLSPDAAKYIDSFTNLKVFGIDSITIDPVGVRVAHRTLKRFMIVESLVHLSQIPENNRRNFDLQTSALRIVGATGGPVVAYAYIPL